MISLHLRFWSKVGNGKDGCWEWRAAINDSGYGVFSIYGWRYKAHRVSYEEIVGPIPGNLVIDHLCRNRACVRPSHMEVVTRAENVRRGIGVSAMNSLKTHCPQGHPYKGDNLRVYNGSRHCQECRRMASSRYNAKKRETKSYVRM